MKNMKSSKAKQLTLLETVSRDSQYEVHVNGTLFMKGDAGSIGVVFGNLDGRNFGARPGLEQTHSQWLAYMAAEYKTELKSGMPIQMNPEGDVLGESVIGKPGIAQVELQLVANDHGFDDFDVIGHDTVHRVCIGHGIQPGDVFNVYGPPGTKRGENWRGSVEKSLQVDSIRVNTELPRTPQPAHPREDESDKATGFKLTQVPAPTRAQPIDRVRQIAELKAILKVGMNVLLENGMAERLAPALVVEICENSFRVQHGQRATLSNFNDASFVVNGKEITLLDDNHFYQSV